MTAPTGKPRVIDRPSCDCGRPSQQRNVGAFEQAIWIGWCCRPCRRARVMERDTTKHSADCNRRTLHALRGS